MIGSPPTSGKQVGPPSHRLQTKRDPLFLMRSAVGMGGVEFVRVGDAATLFDLPHFRATISQNVQHVCVFD